MNYASGEYVLYSRCDEKNYKLGDYNMTGLGYRSGDYVLIESSTGASDDRLY